MKRMNTGVIMGFLESEPVQERTVTGRPMCRFWIRFDKDYVTEDGALDIGTFPCVAYGKVAEFICRELSVGSPLFIAGRPKAEEYWTDDDGNMQTKMVLVLNEAYTVTDP